MSELNLPDLILLVEDQDDDALLTRRALANAGVICDVHHVTSAEEAIEYLLECRALPQRRLPLLILLDLHFPAGEGGSVFLRWLRSKIRLRDIPVAVLSGAMELQTIDEAYDAGATAYLRKPLAPEQIRNLFARVGPHVIRAPRPAKGRQSA